jgi:outer membrane protein TolC
LQFFLPVQNRMAKANLGADRSLLEQERMRVTQLEADVAAERNAITALDAAQENFQAGYGTNLAVIEQETFLAQAQTTEVMTKAAWMKAACQLDRAGIDPGEKWNLC